MAKATKEQQQKADANRAGARTRNWTFVIYPDSAPADWKERLQLLKVPCAVSPLHDNDNLEDGSGKKKPHWHIVLCFESNKTYDQVLELVKQFNGAAKIEKVNSLVGMLRYLTHRDNPEKAQYDEADVLVFGGLNYKKIIMTSADKESMLDEIFDWIDENQCILYTHLMRYARHNRRDWYSLLCNGYTLVITAYIKGMWLESMQQRQAEDENFIAQRDLRQLKEKVEQKKKKKQ